jgi:hypothetical protein
LIPFDPAIATMGFQEISSASEPKLPMDTTYPAKTKKVAAQINGMLTEVMVISFSDRTMVSISQEGRLAQWVSQYNESDLGSSELREV